MMSLTLPLLLFAFWPQPRQIEQKADFLLRLPVRIEISPELQKPAQLLRRELARLFGLEATEAQGKTVLQMKLAPDALSRPEEYMLETSGEGISLQAHDGQGAFWAVHSLIQLLGSEAVRRLPAGYMMPGVRLHDWPESSFRAFLIQGPWSGTPEELKRNLDLLARMKIRYFALEFGPRIILDCDPSIAEGLKLTKAQAKEVIDYGRSIGLEPIGYLNMLGHLDRAYKKPPHTDHGGIMIQNEESYQRFVYPILSEMLEVYGPVEYFHCGMDEAWDLFAWLSQQGLDSASLLAEHIRRVNDFFKAHKVKLAIWHDMFLAPDLEKELKAPVGPANGGPPRNTASALAKIPKEVILDYWFYDPLKSYPALDYLKARGFQVWASPWQTPFSLVRYAQARQVPTLGTLWTGPPDCFYSHTYNPVTAFYAQAAWNPAKAPSDVHPEPMLSSDAKKATREELWGRRTLTFPTARALLLAPNHPGKAVRLSWPRQAKEQYYGVPFDFSDPTLFAPLPGHSRALEKSSEAAYALLPGGEKLRIDGVNTGRGEDQMILYAAPQAAAGTNIYGVEVSVSSAGKVLEVTDYGSGNMPVPSGGFVLSAHLGPTGEKGQRLLKLRPGDPVAILDQQENWLGGYRSVLAEMSKDKQGRLLARHSWKTPIRTRCSTIYLVSATEHGLSPGVILGSYIVRYADGSSQKVPVQYAEQALSVESPDLPHTFASSVWLIERTASPQRCLVYEWQNPKPEALIETLEFEPAPASLEAGFSVLAVTCAIQ